MNLLLKEICDDKKSDTVWIVSGDEKDKLKAFVPVSKITYVRP